MYIRQAKTLDGLIGGGDNRPLYLKAGEESRISDQIVEK